MSARFWRRDGTFNDGSVPNAGGTATLIAHTGRLKVQRTKGNPLATYTSRSLSIALQYQAPPCHRSERPAPSGNRPQVAV
jgi:hypothetical protein